MLNIVTSYETKQEWLPAIREILLYDVKLPANYISSHFMVNTINTYLNDLKWTPTETIMVGIGQSVTQVTPIAVARYVSAIANNGIVYDAQIPSERVGDFDTEMAKEFFYAVSYSAAMNLHIRMLSGENSHHIIEGMFKAFAKALDQATMIDERITDVLSTKGSL